jgi:methylated-DNA-[protein]-cysteine S-methyltransferase
VLFSVNQLSYSKEDLEILELYSCHVDTPEGVFLVHFSDRGIYELFFPGSEPDRDYPERLLPWPRFAADLERYLQGENVSWSEYPLDRSGYPPFVDAVLEQTYLIPWGAVITYRQVAERAGSPLAWRAAGQALSVNRHPIIVPCHRVVGSDGKLGGFSGPEGWKKKLLELEGNGIFKA